MRALVVLLLGLLTVQAVAAVETEQFIEKNVKSLGNNRFQLGDIIIDKNTSSIRFPAEVNMSEGLLELLLCAPHGKTHESLLVTNVDAIELNVALILIGCEKGKVQVKEQGDDTIPDGTLLTIEILYKENGKEKRIRAEDWVYDKKADRPLRHTEWVYTGSFVERGEYLAKVTGTYIVTFHDPFTIIDLPIKEAADDTIFWVNKGAVKKKGFPVELIITKAKGPEKEQDEVEVGAEEAVAPEEGGEVTIKIDVSSEGRIVASGKDVNPDELRRSLKMIVDDRGADKVSVVITSSPRLEYDVLVEVLQICVQAGCSKIGIATTSDKETRE